MREKVNAEQLQKFMKAVGRVARKPARVYLVGGATAVLFGWRNTTIDIDLKLVPEINEVLRALPQLKEELQINVELASPDDFIPALPGWQERSTHITREGQVEFYHYDLHAQALAKIERGHSTDMLDVQEMIGRDLVNPSRLLELFNRIEDELYKYPAIDGKSFRHAVEQLVSAADQT